MAQVKLLKIAADGVPLEFGASDDITLNSFTAGSGPVMSPTGIDMNGQDVTDISDLAFTDPSVGTINQTAGALIVNNIMGKDRSNSMALASDILFGAVGDVAAQLDSFKIPNATALPTATPAASSTQGYLVAYNGSLWMWDGTAWNDLGVADSTNQVTNSYTAEEAVGAAKALYISSADSVSLAKGDAAGTSQVVGFSKAAALITAPVDVVSEGVLDGFSGLSAGLRYYLSAATAGAITSTIPTGTGNTICQVGYAKNTTKLHIHIEQMGRRA
jgi:hypothetical protein